MTLSEERALRNEILFRDANEQIDERRRELEVGGRTPYLCECEQESCTQLIQLSEEEYREVRDDSKHFMIAPGHPTKGSVVTEHDGYLIVYKDDG
jgi:hypothetical protein